MKRFVLAAMFLFASCNADPSIVPDPIDGSVDTSSSSSSSSSSTSSSTSSSSSSSASSSSGGPQGDGSGARLKRYAYTSADGLSAEQPHRFFDAVLQADCAPVRTSVGMLCVTGTGGAFVSQYYSDSACTIPIVYGFAGCAVPTRFAMYSSAGCALEPISTVVDLSPYTSATMYSKGPGCVEVPTVVPVNYDAYQIGTETNYAQFVVMKTEHE